MTGPGLFQKKKTRLLAVIAMLFLVPSQAAWAACSNPAGVAGEMMFNSSVNTMQYCDNTNWIDMGPLANVTSGLELHWKLDESAGTTVSDSSGNGYDGTLTGGAWRPSGGVVDGAMELLGSGEDAEVSGATLLDDNDDVVTIAFWVKATGAMNSWGAFITKMDWSSGNEIGWAVQKSSSTDNMYIRIDTPNGAQSQYKGDLVGALDGAWHHVAFVLDRGTVKGYMDGSLEIDQTYTHGDGFGNTHDVSISGDINMYDDVRIYGRALSALDIAALVRLGAPEDVTTGLIGYWKMDETSGTVAVDSAGGDNDAHVNAGTIAAASTSKLGGAIEFDGSTDFFWVDSTDEMQPVKEITLAAWVKPDVTTSMAFLRAPEATGWQEGWRFIVDGSADYVFHIATDQASTSVYSSVGPGAVAGEWSHIVGTYDGVNSKMYQDGVLNDTSALTGDISYPTPAQGWQGRIGHSNGVALMDGAMDEVRIYNRALTAAEVAHLHTLRECRDPSGAPGRIIYNESSDVMQFCDGTSWVAMGPVPGNVATGSCANPTAVEGTMMYNTSFNIMQFCDGANWIGIGK